jgi:hypothetical protein
MPSWRVLIHFKQGYIVHYMGNNKARGTAVAKHIIIRIITHSAKLCATVLASRKQCCIYTLPIPLLSESNLLG